MTSISPKKSVVLPIALLANILTSNTVKLTIWAINNIKYEIFLGRHYLLLNVYDNTVGVHCWSSCIWFSLIIDITKTCLAFNFDLLHITNNNLKTIISDLPRCFTCVLYNDSIDEHFILFSCSNGPQLWNKRSWVDISTFKGLICLNLGSKNVTWFWCELACLQSFPSSTRWSNMRAIRWQSMCTGMT